MQYEVTTWVEREDETEVRKDFDAWFPEQYIYEVIPMDAEWDDRARKLEAVGALHTMLFDYETWIRENHPDNHDGQDVMTYEQFDEQRADWHESIVRQASVVTGSLFPPEKKPRAQCRHCERDIELDSDGWIDPEATGDDSIWRETCDANETFDAKHEPIGAVQGRYRRFTT